MSPDGVGALAWVALVPLLIVIARRPRGATLLACILYAIVGGAIGILPWLVPAGAAYFATSYWRAAAWVVPSLVVACTLHGALLGVLLWTRPASPGAWAVVWYGALWACWEAVRMVVFPYYPAAVLGLSPHHTVAILQIASVCGVAGVTFVVVASNAAIAALLDRAADARRRTAALAAAALVVGGAAGWGAWRLGAGTAPASRLDVLAVDLDARTPGAASLDRYVSASRDDDAHPPGLIVWPESALTSDLERDPAAWKDVVAFVSSRGTPLLAGGPGSERRSGRTLTRFNSAHLVVPGLGLRSYHKRHLVPFAERWPAFAGRPPPDLDGVEEGREATVFPLAGTAFGVLICFEITDTAGARALARGGARFIVNLTNDAWFTAPPHLAWASAIAVATGLPVVRAANAGPSAIFDRFGRAVATNRPRDGAVLLRAPVPEAQPSFYARHGEVFVALCLALLGASVALQSWRAVRGHGRDLTAGDTPARTHRPASR